MRRYAVRFLVAILTFAIGIALSMVLGLFKPHEIKLAQTWGRRSCSKSFRYVRPQLVTVGSHSEYPLKLVYRGASYGTPQGGIQVSVENRSDKPVSGYLISGEKVWQRSGKTSHNFLDWSFYETLDPGQSRLITLPLKAEGMMLNVSSVSFQDGSNWTHSRGAK